MSLLQDIIPPNLVDNTNAKTSAKPWADNSNDLTNFTLHQSTKLEFDNVFGPLNLDDTNRFGYVIAQAPPIAEFVMKEADVARLFHRQVSGVVLQYFMLMLLVMELDQSGPLGMTSFSGVVDTQFLHTATKGLLAIGEFKTPGVIATEWSPARQAEKAKMLGRELREYAYQYMCPQVFCYDGAQMLIARFRANNREDIRRCDGDMFVIPNIAGADGIPIRYALYRLMVDGLHRLMAATAPLVTIAQPVTGLLHTRHFYWFSGEPYWVDGSNTMHSSVTGVVRTAMQDNTTGIWRWAWMSQNVRVAWCAQLF
ncbi:hypothetical protein EJ07DRAFT_94579 [Lizonia empirigonia]|nr:hypothetical protein EJ07DRAFT_94579 [Lizonia empirigonia]